jgi:TRAP-type C4-dicarboxylate transport system permease small subunit
LLELNRQTEKGPIKWLVLFLELAAATTLFFMMMITVVDVVGRYVFNSPLSSTTELTEVSMGIIVFSVLPIITWRNDHVVVDLLDRLFPPIAHMLRTAIIHLITSVALGFLGKRIIEMGERSLSYGEVTEYVEIPLGGVYYILGSMCWLTAFMAITLGIYRSWIQYRNHLPSPSHEDI